MKKSKEIELDFEIDKLTNSIENVLTGEVFGTEVTRILQKDSKQIKKAVWVFDWHKEFKTPANEIFKLTTINNVTYYSWANLFYRQTRSYFYAPYRECKFQQRQE